MPWVLVTMLVLDLATVKTEPNLERRSDRALENAQSALDAARKAYEGGDLDQTKTALEEVRESVDLSYKSLLDTRKDPRGSGHFKKAELATRQLLRRLDGLRQTMSVLDRDVIDPVEARVSEVHENLIQGIMGKRKK
jgi:exonuclease VII small subunit